MGQLAAPRIGWENEHLATYLLSRVSFVANPITVSDDVGSDFLCTLFESRMANKAEQLFPRNSFAIQIKSTDKTILATNKIEYLTKLELPFFVGVIDREKLRLKIYSGEYIPILFCHYGPPSKLRLSPDSATDIGTENYCKVRAGRNHALSDALLKMPYVTDISAQESREDVLKKAMLLSTLCSRMHQNISARVSQEYIFRLSKPDSVSIMAGSGSITTFRRNFHFRLAEAFYNLQWLHAKQRNLFSIEEFRVYEKCYLGLIEAKIETPEILRKIYNELKSQLADKNTD